MGGYIPSYWDNQIRAALNGRFSDTTIPAGDPAYVHGHTESFMGQMMRHHGGENMFDKHHPQPLERVAHRLHFSLGLGPAPK